LPIGADRSILCAMDLVLRDIAYDDAVATELIGEVQREYVTRYGGVDATPVAPDEFAPPVGVFLLACLGDEAIGCVGLRRHDPRTVEVKRMYIRAAHRRRGHGRALLHAVEARARGLGYRRIILETGTAQPEALGLYSDEGYRRIPGFGHHRDSPLSRCFAKDL
jgi:GNAT superfamily N-acetyltransferase